MAGALPVAGVGLGDQQKFGFPRVENAAWTIAPQGWSVSMISGQRSASTDMAAEARWASKSSNCIGALANIGVISDVSMDLRQ